jgi:hypothetical protein
VAADKRWPDEHQGHSRERSDDCDRKGTGLIIHLHSSYSYPNQTNQRTALSCGPCLLLACVRSYTHCHSTRTLIRRWTRRFCTPYILRDGCLMVNSVLDRGVHRVNVVHIPTHSQQHSHPNIHNPPPPRLYEQWGSLDLRVHILILKISFNLSETVMIPISVRNKKYSTRFFVSWRFCWACVSTKNSPISLPQTVKQLFN